MIPFVYVIKTSHSHAMFTNVFVITKTKKQKDAILFSYFRVLSLC